MARLGNTLIIRHLPAELSDDEKDELLRHFGALKTRIMGTTGTMKHTAFATFKSEEAARNALTRLHQLELLSCRLTAEFCKRQHTSDLPDDRPDETETKRKEKDQTDRDKQLQAEKNAVKTDRKPSAMIDDGCYKAWDLNYPRNINLSYFYPPPSIPVLTNIMNALAACPKFYVQVLHLMNKMNMPAPFGPLTPTPPIPMSESNIPEGPDNVELEEMEFSSTEESEIETDDEGKKVHLLQDSEGNVVKHTKRKRKHTRKKPKLSEIQNVAADEQNPYINVSIPHIDVKDIFEKTEQTVPKKIQLNLPISLTESQTEVASKVQLDISPVGGGIHQLQTYPEDAGGFGKLQPIERATETDSDEQAEEFGLKFISGKELRRGRISHHQMKEFSAFKNYDSGECTSRLYVKNLAKQTSEKDLHYIFGRYINWDSEMEKNMFDIRLMKEGRMKGQAFVTFPSEKVAQEALRDVNGFVLNTKPIVVQFGRSAKAKLPDETTKT